MKISPRMKDELKKDLLNHLHSQANTVTVISAASLSEEEITEIKKTLKVKDAKIVVKIDASILGGIVVQRGSQIIDLSLKNKLDSLQSQIL